jgi:hypothetical protein
MVQERGEAVNIKNDGGPAFPSEGVYYSETKREPELGMTLRDWFAGQAMHSICKEYACESYRRGNIDELADECAESAYIFADAMLKAREMNGGGNKE